MEQKQTTFLITEPVGTLMARYAVPCIISLLVAALYNVVDQIFIANASYLGSYGNAANTAVFPLTVVALAVAVMIGDGCCAFVSISLGSGNDRNASDSIGSAVLLSLIAGILLMAVYLIFREPLLQVFGASVNEQTLLCSREYLFWLTPGIPFYMFGQAMNPVIRSDGSPRFAMAATLAGAAVNIVLDPIFIFGLQWGMMGAAVATVLGQVLTAALSVWYLTRMQAVRLERENFRLHGAVIRRYIPMGICSFLSQISLVAAMAAINNMIRKYGALDPIFGQEIYAQIPMAVVGIVMKFFQIVISVSVGMAAGCIPIVGYNLGADRTDRVRSLFTRLLLCEALTGLIALCIVEFLPGQLITLFGASNESSYYTEFAIRSFRIYLCLMPLACVNKAAFIYLQSLGRALASTLLSMVREVVFGVGLALLLPMIFGLDGVLYSMPAADLLTFLISAVVIRQTYHWLQRTV